MYAMRPAFVHAVEVDLPPAAQFYRMPRSYCSHGSEASPRGSVRPQETADDVTGVRTALEQMQLENSKLSFDQMRSELQQINDGQSYRSMDFCQMSSEIGQIPVDRSNSLNFHQMSSELVQLQMEEARSLNFQQMSSELNRLHRN
jgi:hypothetical protein